MKNIKLKILAFAAIILLAGCEDFLDINNDPNNPTRAELTSLLPYAQATLFGAYGIGTSGVSDILAVYAHHTVQRGNHDDYKIQANEYSLREAWEKSYTVILPDLNQIILQGTEEGRPSYTGIAKLLKAQLMTYVVDLWGDMPYTQAGDPVTFKFPTYDDDMAIYAAMFDLVESGMADLATAQAGGVAPGTDDLVYGGDLTKWVKYGNSLKLNMYNKVRLTSLYDGADVAALLGSPLISEPADDFELRYNTSIVPENRHPGFVREYTQGSPQYFISPYFYLLMKGEQACQNDLMVGIEDPRIPYYFYNQINLPAGDTAQNPVSFMDEEKFLSIWFGSFDRDPNEGFDQSNSQTLVGLYPVGGAYDNGSSADGSGDSGLRGAAPQRMLPAAAVDYVKAELALTAGAPGDPRALLASAIAKSFAEVNIAASAAGAPAISAGEITAYTDAVLALYDAGSAEDKLEIIMTQKWIQEFGFGVETYNDIRRTGFPEVCDPAEDLNDFSIQTNPYPVSLPYNINDLSNNGNAPAQRNQYTDKVFWDVN
jgi:hypothetical protein